MSSTITYGNYAALVDFGDDDGILVSRIGDIRDGVGFHADNVMDLRTAFHEAVDDYIETRARIGKDPLKPYSGNVIFRIAPEVHRKAARAAELAGQSLNQWAEGALRKAAEPDFLHGGFQLAIQGPSARPQNLTGVSRKPDMTGSAAAPPTWKTGTRCPRRLGKVCGCQRHERNTKFLNGEWTV